MKVVSIIKPTLIASAIAAFDKSQTKIEEVTRKATETEDKAIQKVLDAMTIACDKPKAVFMKGNATKNPARAQIKGLFDALVEAEYVSKATAQVYQTCFWMAFEKGIPFSRTLAKDASDAKAASKGNTTETPKAKATSTGKIETTNTEALHKTLSKAIKQARLLSEDEFAAALIDSCLAKWPAFVEIE